MKIMSQCNLNGTEVSKVLFIKNILFIYFDFKGEIWPRYAQVLHIYANTYLC